MSTGSAMDLSEDVEVLQLSTVDREVVGRAD